MNSKNTFSYLLTNVNKVIIESITNLIDLKKWD